jgi:hypothetical protein
MMTTDPQLSSANWPVAPRTLIVGAIVGGAAAILIPLAARRYRRRGPARTACALNQAKKSLHEAARGVAETAADFAAAGKKQMHSAAGSASDAANEFMEATRRRAQQEATRFANAVNAGVDAYNRGA